MSVVEILLKRGADVNAKDNDGDTPLLMASEIGPEDVVRLLIEKGADVNAANNLGSTPLTMACEKGHEDVAHLLRMHGSKSLEEEASEC